MVIFYLIFVILEFIFFSLAEDPQRVFLLLGTQGFLLGRGEGSGEARGRCGDFYRRSAVGKFLFELGIRETSRLVAAARNVASMHWRRVAWREPTCQRAARANAVAMLSFRAEMNATCSVRSGWRA